MYRIKDYYNWTRLEHWKSVLDKGSVGWQVLDPGEVEDAVLEKAIVLLKENCFPVAIVCCCKEDRSKEVLGTPLWNGIFSFLEDKRTIKTENGTICFKDMDDLEKRKILEAHIFAIWVKD